MLGEAVKEAAFVKDTAHAFTGLRCFLFCFLFAPGLVW